MKVLALAALALACASHAPPAPDTLPAMDIHSHAQPRRVRVTHLDLNLAIDMSARVLRGTASLDLERPDRAAPLVLDAQGLVIESVRAEDGRVLRHELGPEQKNVGSALTIELGPSDARVTIAYHTTERSDALQWLAPEQTAGGKQPFLFTQGQSIFTRTWIPSQDTPGVRITYAARIVAPPELTVVMSAEQLGRGADGAFRFRMTHPIPCYWSRWPVASWPSGRSRRAAASGPSPAWSSGRAASSRTARPWCARPRSSSGRTAGDATT
jgi:aminopeptidase N